MTENKITASEIAERLNGAEYPCRISPALKQLAKEAGLVIVYGASDDLMEFEGAIYDEFGCYEGGRALVDTKGLLGDWESIKDDGDEQEITEYIERKKTSKLIEALWAPDEPKDASWAYKTDIPHVTFDVMEDGEIYCRGIIFSIADLT